MVKLIKTVCMELAAVSFVIAWC